MILTIDLGSSATKVALWDQGRAVSVARAPLRTFHPHPGRAEQDAREWWTSVEAACGELDARDRALVDAIGLAAARETFVAITESGECLGPAILWSDARAAAEAASVSERLGGTEAARRRTGVVIGAGSTVAKLCWLAGHEAELYARTRWLLTPRDMVLKRMTGVVATDRTMASRTGLFDLGGEPLTELSELVAGRLPPVLKSDDVAGELSAPAATELGLRPGLPVAVGAGDRQCEVLGAGASAREPVVSWGSTSSVSAPLDVVGEPLPPGLSVSAGALGGYVLEAGLSASGQGLSWLSAITGWEPDALVDQAGLSEPGARGIVALPWLNGARAPWWNQLCGAAFIGLSAANGAGDLARAFLEGVAADAARCLESMGSRVGPPRALRAVGGSASGPWLDVLTGTTDLAAIVPPALEAASAGACMLAERATGRRGDAPPTDPPVSRREPDAAAVQAYRRIRPLADAVASAVLELGTRHSGDTGTY